MQILHAQRIRVTLLYAVREKKRKQKKKMKKRKKRRTDVHFDTHLVSLVGF